MSLRSALLCGLAASLCAGAETGWILPALVGGTSVPTAQLQNRAATSRRWQCPRRGVPHAGGQSLPQCQGGWVLSGSLQPHGCHLLAWGGQRGQQRWLTPL